MARPFSESFSEVKLAPFPKRLGALVYDILITVALWLVAGLVAVTLNDGEAVTGSGYRIFMFLLTYSFFAYFWTRTGQTLGMLAWRLRVQTLDGGRISLVQALVRFLVTWISLGLGGAGYLWILFSKDKQAWHDIAARCCVVEIPKTKKK